MSRRQQMAALCARVVDLIDQRDDALGRAGTAESGQRRLAAQVSELRDQLAARPTPVAEAADDPSADWIAERRQLIRERDEKAALARQLADLLAASQQANEAMCREAMGRAGRLAPGVTA